MKRARCERSAVTPASTCDTGNSTQTARTRGEPDAGTDGVRPAEQQGAAGASPKQATAAAMPPMPFPGPFAYTLMPFEVLWEQFFTGDAAPSPQPVTPPDSTTRGPALSGSASVAGPHERPDGLAPLILAAQQGDLRAVEALLQDEDIDVNVVDAMYGRPALTLAAERGHAEVVSMLLQHPGTAVDQPDEDGNTALMRAAWYNKPDAVACLLAAGAQVNLVNAPYIGSTALSKAARRGHVEVVRMLLEHQAIAIDKPDGDGRTALILAASDNRPDVVACLLAAGADVNYTDPDGKTALFIAASEGHVAVVRMLLEQPDMELDNCNLDGHTVLVSAARTGQTEIVACLLAAGANVDLADSGHGYTALSGAAESGHADVVRMLLNHGGVTVDETDRAGNTALMCAAAKGRSEVVACLLAAGAQANPVNQRRKDNALTSAAAAGHVDVVRILLNYPGLAVDQLDGRGATALICAATHGKQEVVACLLAAGAQVNRACEGTTALISAAEGGHVDVVRMLLKQPGLAVNQLGGHGSTALIRAASGGVPEVVACLLGAGAQVKLPNAAYGGTALNGAAASGHIEIVRMLLKHQDVVKDEPDRYGNTALICSARRNRPDVVACLLAAGASMKPVNHNGDTALSLAVREFHAAVVEVFLLHGAHIDCAGLGSMQFVSHAPIVAITDLCAEQDMPVPAPLASDQAHAFFSELISILHEDGLGERMMRWLLGKGMHMACAEQVARALSQARAAWQLHRGSGKPASPQQQMSYCLGAVGGLDLQGANAEVLEHYQTAGISAAAIERLARTAKRQLENLASLALELAAQAGASMLNGLVDACLAMTGLGYTVDADALKGRLIQKGYCAPLAADIVLGWQKATAALQEERIAVPDALTLGQVMQFLRKQTALRSPSLFARAMQRQLDSRKDLMSLQTILGDSNDEGLHPLFQLQCDQLRQYCAQLLEDANPEMLQGSKG